MGFAFACALDGANPTWNSQCPLYIKDVQYTDLPLHLAKNDLARDVWVCVCVGGGGFMIQWQMRISQ